MIKIVDHKNKKLLKKRSKQIVDIYNKHYNAYDKFNLANPDKCVIAYVDGIKGGVQVEIFENTFAVVYFAGFEEKDRKKGNARKCLAALSKVVNLVGVQVDIFNNKEPWHCLGFKTQSMLNMVPTYLNITTDEFHELIRVANEKVKNA